MIIKKTLMTLNVLTVSFALSSCTTLQKDSHIDAYKLTSYKSNYQKLASDKWVPLNTAQIIQPKQSSKIIPAIRKRLIKLGDLNQTHLQKPSFYDLKLVNAVKHFQYRHNLKPDGIIGKSTLISLNKSPRKRLAQLNQAIAKWQQLPKNIPTNEYIHVNLASYQLNIFKGQQNTLKMKVVVGNPNWPTPSLTSEIQTVVINPHWNIPRNITEKEIIHKISDNIDYLNEEHIKILDGWHKGAKQIDPTTIDWAKYASDEEDLPYRLIQGSFTTQR
jgi:murein L,D-transpeptidase YcbB/YkuD